MRKLRKLLTAAVCITLLASITAQAPLPLTPEEVLNIQTYAGGQPIALSPNGRAIAFVLTDRNDEWNVQESRPTGYVIVQSTGGGQFDEPHALTGGATHSSLPAWSFDGRRLAFVREEPGGARLVVWDGEQRTFTPVGESFQARPRLAPQWDPSGRRIVFAVPQPEEEPKPYRVRVVKSTDARIPGDAFFVDARQALLMSIDIQSGKATPIIRDPVVLRSFRLDPKGQHLTFVAPSPETLGIVGREQNETFVVPLAGQLPAEPRKLPAPGRYWWSPDSRLVFSRDGKLMTTSAEGGESQPLLKDLKIAVSEPIWSPDGARFVTLVPDKEVNDPELEPVQAGMYTIARPFMDLYLVSMSDGSSRNLTSSFEDQVSDPVWSPDGEAVYFNTVDNQTYRESVRRYTLASQQLDVVTNGEESYGQLAVAPGLITLVIESATRPRDLWLIDAGSGARRRVTDLNPQLANRRFSKPELFSFTNADGDRLGALLYKPVALQPNQKVPVITQVYEKMTPGIHRFNPRLQMYVSHGYGMLLPNVKIKVGQPADSFFKCVVPAVTAVREMGFTNERFGIWGHSFGAYATSNLITRTSMFAAAVSGATPPELFRNWASGRDRDSRNIETGQARMGGSPFEYRERYLSQSAFFQLDKVTTPVLILHGEKDLTILFGEGEMMFYALRRLGKTAELVAYAHGDHSLSRHSREDALDVERRILSWFDRYLKTSATRSSPE